jgi:hypothetical protein
MSQQAHTDISLRGTSQQAHIAISLDGNETSKVETLKVEPPKVETLKVEPPKVEPTKVEPLKVEPLKVEPPKVPWEMTKSEKFHPLKACKINGTTLNFSDIVEIDGNTYKLSNFCDRYSHCLTITLEDSDRKKKELFITTEQYSIRRPLSFGASFSKDDKKTSELNFIIVKDMTDAKFYKTPAEKSFSELGVGKSGCFNSAGDK